jgi:aspartyl-tRNA(Asn)/glutamyl-tRNA(Gln) amidotransferase subunit B
MTKYEPVIGLEVHAEMLTESKMFCACPVVDSTAAEPNTTVCEVCSAQPGVLPVINRKAVDYAIMVGLALNCTINDFSQFARKLYFYPDLPKAYQISQYEYPLASSGYLDIENDGAVKRISIRRAHLEEDTGKSFHVGHHSLIDLNRAGVPLLEIVSEPDFRTVEEVDAYARRLRAILVYLGVNHGDMSKGVLRFEANVSVRPIGTDELNTRTEIKNLNSIRSLARASRYEIERQIKLVESGGKVIQQTMGFNEDTGQTVTQRIKEEADDYRYFPEPDLPPVYVSREWVEEIRATLPELPDAKHERFIRELALPAETAGVLVADKAVADYYESALSAGGEAKSVANWLTGEVFRLMNLAAVEIGDVKVTPTDLVGLIKIVEAKTITSSTAKEVLAEMFETGKSAQAIVGAKGLAQISDTGALEAVVARIVESSPNEVATYLGGKESLIGWFVGQAMRETKGQGNAQILGDLFKARLEAQRQ